MHANEVIGLAILLTVFLVYLIPIVVAHNRNLRHGEMLILFNILAGWTLVGWVASLLWSILGKPSASGNYFARHWRGELSLGISYWVNGLISGVVVGVAGVAITAVVSVDPWIKMFVAEMAFMTVLIYVWSSVGIVRSALHARSVWGKIAIVVVILCSIRFFVTNGEAFVAGLHETERYRVENLPKATVRVVSERMVKIDGTFGPGTAKELRLVLDTSPDIAFVELESTIGGSVDEGLAVYDLLRAKHLSTFTKNTCVSSCTIAFMGGERRFLGESGSLQFHQWEIDGVRAELGSDTARRLLVASGVSTDFAARAFSGHDLWVPDRKTMINAGVITHAMDGKPYR
jgi:hypothetical protein